VSSSPAPQAAYTATSASRAEGRLRHLAVVASAPVFLSVLAGCAGFDPISDPPPEPEVQPLEVVVNSSTMPDDPCLLNVEMVRAGDHAVVVVGESGFARVTVVDDGGRVVFATDNAGQRVETDASGKVTAIVGGEGEGEGPPAHLEAGTYTVKCHPKIGEAGEATLRVLPARPGHDGTGTAP
jgi:hypothetical protein